MDMGKRNEPKITVITVCRNVGDDLQNTIDSVASQCYENIEFIVIDGGSTDNTVDVIKRNEACIDKWISEPDNGIYAAMNKGLKMATGDWISFMNVGDAFADNNVISDIFNNGISEIVKLIGGNTCNYYPDGHVEIHYAECADVIPYRLPFSHQACFTRRELVMGDGCFQFDCKYRYAADYNLFYNIYRRFGNESVMIINRAIAYYKQEGSTSLLNFRKSKKEYLRIQASHPNWVWFKEVIKYILGR